MTETAVGTRSMILVVIFKETPTTLSELAAATAALDRLYATCWRVNSGLDATRRGDVPSPSADPVPKTAPSLEIRQVRMGSLVLELVENPVAASAASLLGGGGIWVLFRLLRRGPQAVARFIADVTTVPETYRARKAEVRENSYRRQTDELEARMVYLDRKVADWYHSTAAEQIHLDYQRLLNSSVAGFEVRMVDENGNDVPEPPLT